MKVLICLDLSSHTERILQAAKLVLGTRMPQPEIIVLHVMDETLLSSGTGNEVGTYEEMQEESQRINELAIQYLGAGIRYIEEAGVPMVKIDEALQAINYDLVVFGRKGRSALFFVCRAPYLFNAC